MRVETITTSGGKTRYMLVGSDAEPILPIMRFIRFKDNSGTARNSLRSYCQYLMVERGTENTAGKTLRIAGVELIL
jgi:hypothetical protein